MKFLLDANLPPSLCQRLLRLGHEASHARKMQLGKAADEIVLSKAESHGSVLLTHDLGFGRLMAFSRKDQPSVVIFRVQKLNAEILTELLMKFWPQIEKPLLEGAIVIIEEGDVRIRRLPIGGTGLESELGAQEPRAIYKAGKPKGKPKTGPGKRKGNPSRDVTVRSSNRSGRRR